MSFNATAPSAISSHVAIAAVLRQPPIIRKQPLVTITIGKHDRTSQPCLLPTLQKGIPASPYPKEFTPIRRASAALSHCPRLGGLAPRPCSRLSKKLPLKPSSSRIGCSLANVWAWTCVGYRAAEQASLTSLFGVPLGVAGTVVDGMPPTATRRSQPFRAHECPPCLLVHANVSR